MSLAVHVATLLIDTMYLAQDRQHVTAWQHSPVQVCQDIAWEKLHTGDWKAVSVVSEIVHGFSTFALR